MDFDYLRAEEADALLSAAADTRDLAILSCFVYLGLRSNELRSLNVDDVDWKDETVRVLQAKGGKQRLLPAADIMPTLKAWVALRPPEAPLPALFLGIQRGRTQPYTRISNRQLRTLVKRYGRLAGVGERIAQGVHPHCLRHTCATLMLQNGVDLRVVQEFLGHSSPAVTAFYTGIDMRTKRTAAAVLRRVLSGVREAS